MIQDELWPGGPVFIRDDEAFRLGTDSVLLSSFAGYKHAKRVCDLGCGTGIISVLLAWNNASLTVDGIELREAWADIARDNARLCRLDGRISIHTGDLRRHRDFLEAGAYDLVISNPPYYAEGRGKSSGKDSKAAAREERTCTIGDVCAAASFLTRWGGRFALVHKPERLIEIICALRENGLEPKRLRFVQYSALSAPSLVLIESRHGGNPSLTVEPPLILTDAQGNDTDEVKRIYHRE
jgi:tRNA1Val (adenine37-N6)-methyltransferase